MVDKFGSTDAVGARAEAVVRHDGALLRKPLHVLRFLGTYVSLRFKAIMNSAVVGCYEGGGRRPFTVRTWI